MELQGTHAGLICVCGPGGTSGEPLHMPPVLRDHG